VLICYSMDMMKPISAFALLPLLAATSAWAQTLPPTPQQLQQQHDQAIQNESNATHNNLNQSQQQIQSQAQQPTLTRSGRAVVHPPGYIPMPR
jgi:sensor domain CHASE-containing protein